VPAAGQRRRHGLWKSVPRLGRAPRPAAPGAPATALGRDVTRFCQQAGAAAKPARLRDVLSARPYEETMALARLRPVCPLLSRCRADATPGSGVARLPRGKGPSTLLRGPLSFGAPLQRGRRPFRCATPPRIAQLAHDRLSALRTLRGEKNQVRPRLDRSAEMAHGCFAGTDDEYRPRTVTCSPAQGGGRSLPRRGRSRPALSAPLRTGHGRPTAVAAPRRVERAGLPRTFRSSRVYDRLPSDEPAWRCGTAPLAEERRRCLRISSQRRPSLRDTFSLCAPPP